MKSIKRALSVLLAAILTFGLLTISVSAAGSTPQRELQAKSLFAMGLFKGYDETGTNFGLNDRVTREQALVFLIRMLGLEKEALNWKGTQPYTDVPDGNWARSFIGYAKDKGLTVGVGNNLFGMGRYANMQEMAIFALRGLGYSDASSVKDFSWNTCLTFAKSKGIISSDEAVSPFTRGGAVDIIFGSMAANVKGQEYDLLSKLMNMGVVSQAQYDKAMSILTGSPSTTEKAVTATFTMVNSTGKSIKELYIADSSLTSYGKEFLSNNNYRSWSNGKSISTSFSFYKDTSFDFYVRFADGSEVEATGLSFAKATSAGGKITLGTSNVKLTVGSSAVSTAAFTVKSASTELATQNKALSDRYNASVSRYNKQVDQINALGLSSDQSFTSSMNSLTTSIDALGKEIGTGNSNFTTAQISEYNTALNSLDTLMNELDKLIAAAKAEQAATRTIRVKFVNGTNTNFDNFKAYTAGSSSTAQILAKDYGEATLEFTVAGTATPFTVSFTAAGESYEMPFTFAAEVKSGSIISIQFSVNNSGEVVWGYIN